MKIVSSKSWRKRETRKLRESVYVRERERERERVGEEMTPFNPGFSTQPLDLLSYSINLNTAAATAVAKLSDLPTKHVHQFNFDNIALLFAE